MEETMIMQLSETNIIGIAVHMVAKAELISSHNHEQLCKALGDNVEYIHERYDVLLSTADIHFLAYKIREFLT